MAKKVLYYILIFILHLTANRYSMGQVFQELKRPYFCSTCFTTTQEQNYHCCFHFFKCCAEARLGSRSTTSDPQNPGLPSGMTFFVQNRNPRPCTVDCRDIKQHHNLCCRLQSARNSQKADHYDSGESIFKPAFNIQLTDDSSTHSSKPFSTEQSKTNSTTKHPTSTSVDNTGKLKYQNLGLEITGSPQRQNLKNINSEKKIFYSPSIIFDYETEEDTSQNEQSWKKQGWYTKDLLNQEKNNQS